MFGNIKINRTDKRAPQKSLKCQDVYNRGPTMYVTILTMYSTDHTPRVYLLAYMHEPCTNFTDCKVISKF